MSAPIELTLTPDGTTIANPAVGGHNALSIVGGGTLATVWDDSLDATYGLFSSPDGFNNASAVVSVDSMPVASSIVKIQVYARLATTWPGTGEVITRALLRIAGNPYYSVLTYTNTLALGWHTFEWTTNPATGLPWTTTDINSDTFLAGVHYYTTGPGQNGYSYEIRVKVFYYGATIGLKVSQDVGSRNARMFRLQTPLVKIGGPLLLADHEPMSIIQAQGRYMPASDGLGWGKKKWQRETLIALGASLDLDNLRVTRDFIATRGGRYATRLWDTMRSDEEPTSEEPGIARLSPGAGFMFSRGSKAWIDSPVSESDGLARVIEVPGGQRKICFQGMLIENERTNLLGRNAFISGTTGITLAGTGINGSSIAQNTSNLLIDTNISAYCLRFLAGSPHAADLIATFPDTSVCAANAKICLSVDHLDQAGEYLYYRLQRLIDNYFWNGTTWVAGAQNRQMPTRTALNLTQRYAEGPFSVGANATALRFSLLLPTGGTASRVIRAHHVQIEVGNCVSSRIISDASIYTRTTDDYLVENNINHRTWDMTRGTGFLSFAPNWNSADFSADAVKILGMTTFDANNNAAIYYYKSFDGIVHQVRAGGNYYYAIKTCTLVRGTKYAIRWRWTSTEAELGLTARTIDVFVNGAKGTSDTPGTCAMTSSAFVYIGHQAGIPDRHADGLISDFDISPFVYTDGELLES